MRCAVLEAAPFPAHPIDVGRGLRAGGSPDESTASIAGLRGDGFPDERIVSGTHAVAAGARSGDAGSSLGETRVAVRGAPPGSMEPDGGTGSGRP